MRHPGRDPQAHPARGSQQPSPAKAATVRAPLRGHVRRRPNLLITGMAWRLADYDGSQRRWAGD
jgi:hypothetical protein